jgi:hypothetical protein
LFGDSRTPAETRLKQIRPTDNNNAHGDLSGGKTGGTASGRAGRSINRTGGVEARVVPSSIPKTVKKAFCNAPVTERVSLVVIRCGREARVLAEHQEIIPMKSLPADGRPTTAKRRRTALCQPAGGRQVRSFGIRSASATDRRFRIRTSRH